VADKDEEIIFGQSRYTDFEFAMHILTGGWLMLDYDENIYDLLKEKLPSSIDQNSALLTSRLPPASIQV